MMQSIMRASGALLCAAAVMAGVSGTGAHAAAEYVAVVAAAEGSVSVRPDGSSRWSPAKVGMGLAAGDTVRTETDATALVILELGTTVRIERDTEVLVQALAVDTARRSTDLQLHLTRSGSVFAYANAARPRSVKASVRTPTCIAAVRGTGLHVAVDQPGDTTVMVFEGRVVVRDFVKESGLPTDKETMLANFLHEVSLRANQRTTVTARGVSRASRIPVQELSRRTVELAAMKAEAARQETAWASTPIEERAAERARIRTEALAEAGKR